MKMNKGAILASMAIITLASVFAGAGTMAWLNDTETAKFTGKAGTKDLWIATGTHDVIPTSGWKSGTTLEITGPTNWDDEQEFTFVIWFKNVGNTGATFLYREYGGYDDYGFAGTFKDAVELVSMYEYYDGAWDGTNWVQVSGYGWDTTKDHTNNDGCFTLRELLDMEHDQYDEKCFHYSSIGTEYYLPAGGVVAAEYTFKLRGEETTPAMMGESFSFTITCHMTNEDIHTFPGPIP